MKNSEKRAEGTYKNKELDGLCTRWGSNGQKMAEENYKDGTRKLQANPEKLVRQDSASRVSPLFANQERIRGDWYTLGRSRQVKSGAVSPFFVGSKKLVLWRDGDGRLIAQDPACPHTGADLSQGQVVDNSLRCAFHHWRFDGGGRCIDAPTCELPPDLRLRCYPTEERWGLMWVFLDRTFRPLPDGHESLSKVILLRAHPHLVIGNGFDVSHLGPVHRMELSGEVSCEQAHEHGLTLKYEAQFTQRYKRVLTGSTGEGLSVTFMSDGGSFALLTVTKPFLFQTVFTARPRTNGGTATQLAFLLPPSRPDRWIRAMLALMFLLADDKKILDAIDFSPGWVPSDAVLRKFFRVVNAE